MSILVLYQRLNAKECYLLLYSTALRTILHSLICFFIQQHLEPYCIHSVLPKARPCAIGAHIFRWRIKNPLDGPAGASVFSLNK